MEKNFFRDSIPEAGDESATISTSPTRMPGRVRRPVREPGQDRSAVAGHRLQRPHRLQRADRPRSEIGVKRLPPCRRESRLDRTYHRHQRPFDRRRRSPKVPRQAVTMGMKPILAAREILLLACFPEQQEPLSGSCTAVPPPNSRPATSWIIPIARSSTPATALPRGGMVRCDGTFLIGYDVERIPGRVPGEKWVGQPVPDDATEVFLHAVLGSTGSWLAGDDLHGRLQHRSARGALWRPAWLRAASRLPSTRTSTFR